MVGCGNLLRGDDAAGPILVRLLADRDLPDGVRLVDGGTAGMDVAFAMRGARRVIVVDDAGELAGVAALADLALAGKDEATAQVVKEVSEPGRA